MTTRKPTRSLLILAMLLASAAGCATSGGQVSSWRQPKKNTPTDKLWAYAQQSEAEGRLDEAVRAYGELYRRNPNTAQYAHRLGVVFTLLGEDSRAQNAYARARQLTPNNPELLIDMGYAAYLKDDYAQAEELLKSALVQAPGNTRGLSNLALAVGFQGRDDESLGLFQRVNGNNDVESLCNLAYIQAERGDTAKAVETYQQALQIDPHAKQASLALAHLKSQPGSLPSTAAETVARKIEKTQAPIIKEAHPVANNQPVEPTAQDDEAAESTKPVTLAIADQSEKSTPVLPTANAAPAPMRPTVARRIPTHERPAVPRELTAIDGQPPAFPSNCTVQVESSNSPQTTVVEQPETSAPLMLPSDDGDARQTTKAKFAWAEPSSENDAHSPQWFQERLQQIAARRGQSGFMGFCPVALRDEQKLVDARPEFRLEYQSQTYEFSSSEALQKFKAQPDRYLPAAGGLDVVAISQGTLVSQGSLEHALWFRHKLYLFLNEQSKELFRTQCRQFAVEH